MTALIVALWPALAAAALAGLGFAAVFGPGSGLPSARPEVRIGAVLLLLGGMALVWLETVPGRPGLWLDIGVLCALAYAAGVGLGTVARWAVARARRTTA